MKTINVFRPEFRVEECLNEIRECLEKGWTGLGFKTVEFEESWKAYTALPYAHFLNSATSGLHLAVKILKDRYGWDNGSEIISTPLTFVSTNHAILYETLTPVFADIDLSLNLSPESVKAAITPKTKAVLFVGLGGNAKNLLEIRSLAQKHGLKMILDASHMAGTKVDGRHVGYDMDATVFSFQAVKNLPTSDSGMLCFADSKLDETARKLSWLGIDKDTFSRSKSQSGYKWKYDVPMTGYKYHGNSLTAAMGLVGLRYLDSDNQYRRDLADAYTRSLTGTPGLRVIRHEDCESSRHLFQVVVEKRECVIKGLNDFGINPGVHYRDNREYLPYRECRGACPQCEFLSHRLLSLPLHMQVRMEDVDFISETLKSLLKKSE